MPRIASDPANSSVATMVAAVASATIALAGSRRSQHHGDSERRAAEREHGEQYRQPGVVVAADDGDRTADDARRGERAHIGRDATFGEERIGAVVVHPLRRRAQHLASQLRRRRVPGERRWQVDGDGVAGEMDDAFGRQRRVAPDVADAIEHEPVDFGDARERLPEVARAVAVGGQYPSGEGDGEEQESDGEADGEEQDTGVAGVAAKPRVDERPLGGSVGRAHDRRALVVHPAAS